MAGLYLHIPFCEHKCIYCDFYSIENLKVIDAYLNALDCEIGMYAERAAGENFGTIYFGGGTPSLLSPAQLGRILSRLYSRYSITPDAEITVETNPGTIDKQKLKEYRALGINRLSIGIQSFHEDELAFLTRIHSAREAKECVHVAHQVGFDNVSLDLIFALPNQSVRRWQANLYQAVELEPQHISAYSLIVERGTPLARMVAAKQVSPVPVEKDALMYETTMDLLAAEGYEHYEVSNYARPGYRSRHNSNYWNHTNYLAFGPSAHSFWSSLQAPESRRWWNVANLRTYIEKLSRGAAPVAGDEILTGEQLLEEAIMLGLRSDGVDIDHLYEQFGLDFSKNLRFTIQELLEDGFAVMEGCRLRLTDRGYLVCDEVCNRMLAHLEPESRIVPVPLSRRAEVDLMRVMVPYGSVLT